MSINGRHCWLWRAVDQHGDVLDVLVQSRRNRQAAEQPSRELASTHKSSEKGMRRFKSACHLQRFVSVHDQVDNTVIGQ